MKLGRTRRRCFINNPGHITAHVFDKTNEEIWQAKVAAMRRTYNACQFRPETGLMFNFVTAELSNFITETTEDGCAK